MRISGVDVFPLEGREQQGGYGRPLATIVRVRTDEGVIGYGETDSCPSVIKAIVDAPRHHEQLGGLAPLAVGEDPTNPAALWRRMAHGTLYGGRGGPVTHAMAAIDMAVWDIAGKVAGRPLHALLGAKLRSGVRAYVTHPLGRSIADTAAHARRLVAAGFTAVKFGWTPFGADADEDEAIVRGLREAIGPDVDLLIDCGNAFDVEQALERIRRLSRYRLYWLEEPLPTDDCDGYGRLADAGMRIAAGEQCTTPLELRQLVDSGRVAVVQIDIGRFGITPAIDFVAYAQARGVKCVNHTYTLDLALAASLHLAAILDDPLLLEVPGAPNDLRAIVRSGVRIENGIAMVPEGPGLGVEIDEARLAAAAGIRR